MQSVRLTPESIREIVERSSQGIQSAVDTFHDPYGKTPAISDILSMNAQLHVWDISDRISETDIELARACRNGIYIGYWACDSILAYYGQSESGTLSDELEVYLISGLKALALMAKQKPDFFRDMARPLYQDTGDLRLAYNDLALSETLIRSSEYILQLLEYVLICRVSFMEGDEEVSVEQLDELGEVADDMARIDVIRFREILEEERGV